MNKALEIYNLKNAIPQKISNNDSLIKETPNNIFIKADKRLIQIDLSEIFYLESYGNYVKVWIDKKHHLTARTLSSFAEQLSKKNYFRIHKSYIINKNHIQYVEGNFVVMKNNQQLPIGKNHRQEFKKFIA